jgi:hypothetical protein
MPTELTICYKFSTPNLAHPADHTTQLRTDPLLPGLGVMGAGPDKTQGQVGFLGVMVYRPMTRQRQLGRYFFLKLHRQRTKKGILS